MPTPNSHRAAEKALDFILTKNRILDFESSTLRNFEYEEVESHPEKQTAATPPADPANSKHLAIIAAPRFERACSALFER